MKYGAHTSGHGNQVARSDDLLAGTSRSGEL